MPSPNGSISRYVRVEGLNELRQTLRKLEDDVSKKGLQQSLKADFRAAAEMIASSARTNAPKGDTGRLEKTIKPKGALRGAAVVAGGSLGVKYAGPIEYGWPSRPNKRKRWRGGPITAAHFLQAALESNVDAVRVRMEATVQRMLDQVRGVDGG